ncbi:MAG: argininosuccinate synthase [Gammaproteobacteria bacterium]|nr:argininosuccinate synthase [Gammaproteobacteria bacterium]
MRKKIILAYSGGLDTSCAIKWLQEKYGYDVIAVAMDVGEGKDLIPIQEKALKIGAIGSHVLALQDTFADEYLLPALQANALYEGTYPLISALSRPLIAKSLVEIAQKEHASAVAHGCTGKGNDQVRFDVSISALDPTLDIIAPARENPLAREDAILYAKANAIPLPIELNNPFSIDQNLWGRSCECGVLEDPWVAPPEEAYALTRSIQNAPEQAEEVTLDFVRGCPVALNGEKKSLASLIQALNLIAGTHGVGRIDHIENRLVGIKSREVYEAPAAMTLIAAHRALEALTLTREVAQCKPFIEIQFANMIYNGLWFSELKSVLQAFITETQKYVTGKVRIRLHKGHAIVVGRESPYSLYDKQLATYASDDQFDHHAALGFIKLWGLPTVTQHQVLKRNDNNE